VKHTVPLPIDEDGMDMDLYRLHTEWIGAGREHATIILAPQQRNRVEFLSN
jgi:hypothetical protein